jgi:hypothetical protein
MEMPPADLERAGGVINIDVFLERALIIEFYGRLVQKTIR